MARHTPRARRLISPHRARLIRMTGGFRYSLGRDAYVLRFVGNRFGPVYKIESAGTAASAPQVTVEGSGTTTHAA
jgi:hypothetical protein